MKRKIVRIDEELCNGCGECVPSCAEGAIEIVDGKARLVAENLCDGLGACLGECPENAIIIEEREAESFSEDAVEERLTSLKEQEGIEEQPAPHFGCPSARVLSLDRKERPAADPVQDAGERVSELTQWPLKLQLVPPTAPFFRGKDLVVTADCSPVAFGDYHRRFLRGKAMVLHCPKFGDQSFVLDKLTEIFSSSGITGVTVLRAEVPCCSGLTYAVHEAVRASGRDLPVREVVVGVQGDLREAPVPMFNG
jgi:NAD-dependent dihydropyrimidine dehydrogenase PreA subunit